jgi:hypothetical protein
MVLTQVILKAFIPQTWSNTHVRRPKSTVLMAQMAPTEVKVYHGFFNRNLINWRSDNTNLCAQ